MGGETVSKGIAKLLILLALVPMPGLPLLAQSKDQPDQGFGPVDTSAPAIPPDKIVQQFAAKESEFRHALDNYTYQRDVRIQTINDDGKVDGEYRQVVQITFDTNGRKSEHVTFAPQNTLERITMSPADVSDIEQRLPFVLTTEDVGQYNLTYAGRQKVDEVDCYVFDVAPKDLQIVITSAKNVPDDMRKGHEDLSPPFTTYREQVDGKYWFPVYTKADAELHFSGGSGYMSQDVRIRQIVRYTDYKQFRSTVKLIFQGQDVTNNQAQPQGGSQPANGQQPQQSTPPASAPPASTPPASAPH